MLFIPFSDFRKSAADYLDAAAAGEEIRITRHGKVVARLVAADDEEPAWKKRALRLKGKKPLSTLISQNREESL